MLAISSVLCRDRSIKHFRAMQAMLYNVAVEAIRRPPPPGQTEAPPPSTPLKPPPREVLRSGIIQKAHIVIYMVRGCISQHLWSVAVLRGLLPTGSLTLFRDLAREVICKLAEMEQWPVGWAFDGVHNIYSPTNFLPQHEEERKVCLLHPSPPWPARLLDL